MDNSPVIGCEQCRTTAGRFGCPVHGGSYVEIQSVGGCGHYDLVKKKCMHPQACNLPCFSARGIQCGLFYRDRADTAEREQDALKEQNIALRLALTEVLRFSQDQGETQSLRLIALGTFFAHWRANEEAFLQQVMEKYGGRAPSAEKEETT